MSMLGCGSEPVCLSVLPGSGLHVGLPAAAKAARAGADATARITVAKAGRASYVSAAQLDGHRDPGAEATALMLEALAR